MSQNESNPQVSYDRPPVRRKRRKKTPWQKFKEAYLPLILVLVGLAVVVVLIIGLVKLVSRTPAPQKSNSSESQTLPTEGENQALLDQAAILAAQYDYDGALTLLGTCTNPDAQVEKAVTDYTAAKSALTVWPDVGKIPLISFQPLIADTARAFDGDDNADYYARNSLTVSEFTAVLEQLYAGGYVLVSMEDMAAPDNTGTYQPGQILLPEGKKPLILSYDDTNYYEYMLTNGFAYKLILDEDGKIASWGKDPQGNEVVSRDLDAIPMLDKFVEEHPDFSPFGAKACLSVTGYEGILGYRTQTDHTIQWTDEMEAYRQSEIEAVKPIIAELKRTGWTFGSHTFGHIRLGTLSMEKIQSDTQRWFDEVGSLVGPTNVLFYPHGERPDGDDWKTTGPVFQYLQSQGFRILCSVGIESFSYIKKDICAVICDRLHPDGTTLRSKYVDQRYGQFYDVREIIDLDARPDYGVNWQ